MKKNLIMMVVLMLFVNAASFSQIRVGLGLTVGTPAGDFSDIVDLGIGGYIEPKYALNEKLDVGLHLGSTFFAGGSLGGSSVSASQVNSFLLTSDFKVSDTKVTPYFGAGLGLYVIDFGSIDASANVPEIDLGSETRFGFAPRAGLLLGKLNLGVSYNIVKDTNYLAFMLGFEIGSRTSD